MMKNYILFKLFLRYDKFRLTMRDMATYTIREAAQKLKLTKAAIDRAIVLKRLPAIKMARDGRTQARWVIDANDLDVYVKSRWSRDVSRIGGVLVFDIRKGEVSAVNAAIILNVPTAKIYHAIRAGKIPTYRKKTSYIISIEDLETYKNKYLN